MFMHRYRKYYKFSYGFYIDFKSVPLKKKTKKKAAICASKVLHQTCYSLRWRVQIIKMDEWIRKQDIHRDFGIRKYLKIK